VAPGKDVPFRQQDPVLPDRFIYEQGNIDPSMPIVTAILDNSSGGLHSLTGISSLQRTLVSAPGGGVAQRFLVADQGGVFYFELDPGPPGAPGNLVWAFVRPDYETPLAGNVPPLGLGRLLSPSSARLLANGLVLVTSRTATPDQLPFATQAGANGIPFPAGGDIFLLDPSQFNSSPNANPRWPGSSIVWRAPAPRFQDPANPARPDPSLPANAANPIELPQTYTPEQPSYADLMFLP
jgi:hypothetical protein